jgi:hypothetical protein
MAKRSILWGRALLVGGLAVVLASMGLGLILIPSLRSSPGHPVGRQADGSDSPFLDVPSGSAAPSGSPSASPSASGPASGPTAKAAKGGTGARLRQVDGGPNYYAKFANPLPTSSSFFPVGVWFESVVDADDIQKDRAAGLNTYVELTSNSNLGLVRQAGMYAMPSTKGGNGTETVAWLLADEADMEGGPGNGTWTGNGCSPSNTQCGYTIMQTTRARYPNDNRMRYANYGKGITFWESNAEAARFVNSYQDVLSADNYWFTDNDICVESQGGTFFPSSLVGGNLPGPICHRAANYGRTVDRVRSLVSPPGSKPVWAFVELGHPATENNWPTIQPAQVRAAVWSSLIHGARGIIYFNHSFGGACQTQHILRDSCYGAIRSMATQVNGQIRALAPVLNAPFADGVVTAGPGVDVSTRWYDGHFYVLAGAVGSAQTASFTVRCTGDATVSVLNENRTLKVTGGAFTDRFTDGNAVHIYRIDGGSSCGAY